jgi:hypothetical protein
MIKERHGRRRRRRRRKKKIYAYGQCCAASRPPGLLECHCLKQPSAWRGFLQDVHQ